MDMSEIEKTSVIYAMAHIRYRIMVIEEWLNNPRGKNIEKDRENFNIQLIELKEDLIEFEKISESF